MMRDGCPSACMSVLGSKTETKTETQYIRSENNKDANVKYVVGEKHIS